ncbi:uncharacterized protein PFLUO_LOCUS7250 [Penicillium psychrofluorescens]|uniref:uncharacterized protein n=1 Tax=Penicillium psychrofluorescens TaxID=3158075 RepID=UPI003CCCB530
MAPKETSTPGAATVPVNIDELRKSKDAMLMRLMDLQSYVAELSKSYLKHAENVINGGPATIEIPPMFAGISSLPRAGSPGVKSEAGDGKQKRKRVVDPNAPKRPLTPYFLYMQHRRGDITKELGQGSRPRDVAEEGTRRWQQMSDTEKEIWKKLYGENLDKYKVEVAAYKAKKAGDDDDPAANQLQNDFAVAEHESENSSSSESEDDSSSDESPSPKPKEKTPPKSVSKRRRSEAKKEVDTPAPAKKASPQKKGKKSEPPASAKKADKPAESKPKRKKRKSETDKE